MNDSLYLRSLLATIFIYLIIVGLLVTFVVETGVAGVFLITIIVVLLVSYFYGCFRRF